MELVKVEFAPERHVDGHPELPSAFREALLQAARLLLDATPPGVSVELCLRDEVELHVELPAGMARSLPTLRDLEVRVTALRHLQLEEFAGFGEQQLEVLGKVIPFGDELELVLAAAPTLHTSAFRD